MSEHTHSNNKGRKMKRIKGLVITVGLATLALCSHAKEVLGCAPLPATLKIDDTWGGTRVRAASIETENYIYIAYYDNNRWLSIAQVEKCTGTLRKVRLPSQFKGWDAHNYVTLAMDSQGRLHVAGNMHVSPLVYARMDRPDDLDSLKQLRSQIGTNEERTTYPKFFKDAAGNLIFTYRDGSSGDGDQILNRLDGDTWRRVLDKPLFGAASQTDHANAYATDIDRRPDGFFHTAWVWRQTPNVETNYDVNYARSRDLVHWEDAFGKPLMLPITPRNSPIVDKIPERSGLFNNIRLSTGVQGEPIISYLKFDNSGYSQLYHAIFRNNKWEIHQSSSWTYRWAPQGGGSIPMEISFGGVKAADGKLTESIRQPEIKSQIATYDNNTLKILSLSRNIQESSNSFAGDLGRVKASKNTIINTQRVSPQGKENTKAFNITWESMPPDTRDRARECRPQIASCDYKYDLLLHSER